MELSKTQRQIKELKIRLGLGQIDKETYDLTFEHLSNQLLAIGKELNSGKPTISNLEELLEKSLQKLENRSKIWLNSSLDEKRRLHKTMFQDGIFFDPKNHQYLTRKMNSYVELVSTISNTCGVKKRRTLQENPEESCLVLFEQLYKKHLKKQYAGKPTKKYLKLIQQIERTESITYHEIERALFS